MANHLKDSKDRGILPPKMRPYKEGSIEKQGGRIKTWKKRWCILNDEGLHYFKSQNTIEKGSIPLDIILNVESEDKPVSKRKNCFKVVTGERIYRICATDSLDKDEWIQSISKLLKPKNLNHSGSQLKNSSNHSVDINRLKLESSDTSSESSSFSSSFSGPNSTITLTPLMIALKDKFTQPNFQLELNKKKDLLSYEEVDTLLKLLDGQMRNEMDIQTKQLTKDIYDIKNIINAMRDKEIEQVELEYRTKKNDIQNEILKKQNNK